MKDVYEHNPDDHDDPAAGLTWYLALVGVLLLVVIILGVTALYFNVQAEMFQRQVVNTGHPAVLELRQKQEALLAGPPRTIEREQQGETVTVNIIPIEQAMEIVVREARASGGAGG